jgi:hypothetical protein
VERAAAGTTTEQLWQRPGTAAPAGYHLRHLAGSLDRLLSYARGEMLSEAPASALLSGAVAAIDRALEQIRRTSPDTLLESREVGRARLPSTVLGLLFHAAEHTTRHTGQLITTLKVVRPQRPATPELER